LILSSIVHYEIEFIHPFEDGNGRIGRFWQTLLLSHYDQIFKFIPIESVIEKYQDQYYRALEVCDQAGDSSVFIEFMLQVILDALSDFDGEVTGIVQSPERRLDKAREHFGSMLFSRKEYMELFQSISSATASRDLKLGVKRKILAIKSKLNQSRYCYLIKK
jgi:Fic family protein